MAEKQAARPTCRPADRSVPLVIRQPDTPQAMINRGAMLITRLLKLRILKKFWVVTPVNRASRIIRMIMALLERNFFTSNFFSIVLSPPHSNWVARAMMFSWLASSPLMKPVTRPSHMTMMRSDMPMSSLISEEIMITLLPCLASSAMMQ